jgi:hypothetical protein
MSCGELSGEEVEATLLRLRAGERRLEVRILRGLIELDRRKLYLDWGYASLFAYCVDRLGYCESSAGDRGGARDDAVPSYRRNAPFRRSAAEHGGDGGGGIGARREHPG